MSSLVRSIVVLVLASGVALAEPSAHDRAVALTVESMQHYERGEFAAAIDLLEQAYALEQSPIILYNLGRAHEATGDLEQAIGAYRRYLAGAVDAADRPGVEQRIATLARQLAERRTLERERDEARRRALAAPVRRPRAAPWIIVGIGALGVGAGAALGIAARSSHDDALAAATGTATADANRSATRLATAATITLIAGGATMLGGLAWGIVDVSASGPRTGAVVAVSGRF